MAASDSPDGAAETVELFGVKIGHAMSWPPMAGRMFATLMLHDGPMTSRELQKALQASAGTISVVSRLLIRGGVVRRIKTPGQREKSYVYRDDAWPACIRHDVEVAAELLEMAKAAASSSKDYPPHIRRRFEEMRDFYTFVATGYARLAQEFEALTKERAPSARPEGWEPKSV